MTAKNDGAKSFVAYYSWWEVIGRLDEHQQAQVLQAMFATGGVCEKPELDFVAEIAFIPIEREIQANLDKWEATREKRREAGRKGGKASRKSSKNESEANEANAYFAKQNEAMLSNAKQSQANEAIDIDTDIDIDIDIDTDIDTDIDIDSSSSCINNKKKKGKKDEEEEAVDPLTKQINELMKAADQKMKQTHD